MRIARAKSLGRRRLASSAASAKSRSVGLLLPSTTWRRRGIIPPRLWLVRQGVAQLEHVFVPFELSHKCTVYLVEEDRVDVSREASKLHELLHALVGRRRQWDADDVRDGRRYSTVLDRLLRWLHPGAFLLGEEQLSDADVGANASALFDRGCQGAVVQSLRPHRFPYADLPSVRHRWRLALRSCACSAHGPIV